MRKKVLLFLMIIISVTFVSAKNIKGIVLNSDFTPLENVSIHLKSSPFIRVFTDAKGLFVINLEGVKHRDKYKLLFSHIGYETKECRVKGNSSNKIVLIEKSIIVDDVIVHTKLSRKAQKKRKISVINKFKEQLKKDFILEDRTYKVLSNFELVRDAERVVYNKLIGEYKELIGVKPDNKDSIALIYTSMDNYMDRDIELGLKDMSDMFIDNNVVSKKRKKNKRILDSTFYNTFLNDSILLKDMLDAHKVFWSFNRDVIKYVASLDDNYKRWTIIDRNGQMILSYKNKRGMLGIIKHLAIVNFIVNPDTYSLEQISEEIKVELNIPFGYKLPPDAVMLLNLIYINSDRIEKYRVRHLYVDVITNTIYKKIDESKHVDERIVNLDVSLIDTKKRTVKIEPRVFLKVLSVQNSTL